MGNFENGSQLLETISRIDIKGENENISKDELLTLVNNSISRKKEELDKYMDLLFVGENIDDKEALKDKVQKYFDSELLRITENINNYTSIDDLILDIEDGFSLGDIEQKVEAYKNGLIAFEKDFIYQNIDIFSTDKELITELVNQDKKLAYQNIDKVYDVDPELVLNMLDELFEEEMDASVILTVLDNLYLKLGNEKMYFIMEDLLNNSYFTFKKGEEGFIGDEIIKHDNIKNILLKVISNNDSEMILLQDGLLNVLYLIDKEKAIKLLKKIGIGKYLEYGDLKDLSNFSMDDIKIFFNNYVKDNEISILGRKYSRLNSDIDIVYILTKNVDLLSNEFVTDILVKLLLKELGLSNEGLEVNDNIDFEELREILFNIFSNDNFSKQLYLDNIDFKLLLKSPRYKDSLKHIGNDKNSIIKIKLLNYYMKMDMPYNIIIENLDNSDSYDFNKLSTGKNDIKLLIGLLSKDFSYTDAKKGRIDPKVFEGTIVDGLTRYYESKNEKGIDLSKFNDKYLDSYLEMVKLIMDIQGKEGLFIDKVIEGLDYDNFVETHKGKSFMENYLIIKKYGYVYPVFEDVLYEKLGYTEDFLISQLDSYRDSNGKIIIDRGNSEEIKGLFYLIKEVGISPNLENELKDIILNYDKGDLFFIINNNLVDDLNLDLPLDNNIFDDIYSIENMRNEIQRKYKKNGGNGITGEEFVFNLESKFFESHKEANYGNFNEIYNFAKNLKQFSENSSIDKDKVGVYLLGANFAFNKIISFLEKEIGSMDSSDLDTHIEKVSLKLAKYGIDLNEILNDFKRMGVPFEIKESNISKGLMNIAKGNFAYLGEKIVSKIGDKIDAGIETVSSYIPDEVLDFVSDANGFISSSIDNISFFSDDEIKDIPNKIDDLKFEQPKYSSKEGVSFSSIEYKGEKFDMIKFSSGITCEFTMNKSGFVSKKDIDNKSNNLVFLAPLSFTTMDRRMTEIAAKNGEIVNLLMSAKGKEGLVLTNSKGELITIKKTAIKLSEFKIPELIENGDRTLNIVNRYEDYLEFIEIIKKYKFSLMANMLLVDGGKVTLKERKPVNTNRRILLTFKDGTTGVLSGKGTIYDVSTLAVKLGAVRAVYMDTGSYDIADYYDNENNVHLLGKRRMRRTATNFVVFRTK